MVKRNYKIISTIRGLRKSSNQSYTEKGAKETVKLIRKAQLKGKLKQYKGLRVAKYK